MILLSAAFVCGQTADYTFSGDYDQVSLDSFAVSLEGSSGLIFYYLPEWTSGMKVNITGSPGVYFTENCTGCATGMVEIPNLEISVYPKPVYDFITIRSAHPDHLSVEITSSAGQLISSKEMDFDRLIPIEVGCHACRMAPST